jgi:predicted  nucleic acid-binding Zn-ribbon protein
LRHRKATLPERAELAAREAAIAAIDRELAGAAPARDDAAARQRQLEDELASLETKISELDRQLYSGTVSSPRELQAMQSDIDSLQRHRSALEDRLLDVMGELEPLESAAGGLRERRAELATDAERLHVAIDEQAAVLDAEIAVEQEARDRLAKGLPPQLVTLYEQLRGKLEGVGAARLEGGACGGCHLRLPATQLDAIKYAPPEAIVRCDQCGRILVR